jgi:hypothetical protein
LASLSSSITERSLTIRNAGLSRLLPPIKNGVLPVPQERNLRGQPESLTFQMAVGPFLPYIVVFKY